jgi:hypothetical protein
MKKTSLFLFAVIFSLSSCSSDDSSSSSSSSDLNINGEDFNITDAKATDNYHFYYETHSEFEFSFADGPITVSAEPDSYYGFETDNASIAISLSASSLGSTFQNGVYQFDENFGLNPPSFSFFDNLTINIDGNNDHDFNDAEDDYLAAVAGTVTVSGTAPNHTIAFDVTLSNNEHFQYTYNGGFDYVNNRNE